MPLSPTHGWFTKTISDKEIIVNNITDGLDFDGEPCKLTPEEPNDECQSWSTLERTSIRVPPHAWAKIKAFIINSCKQYGSCSKDIRSWERKILKVDEQLENN